MQGCRRSWKDKLKYVKILSVKDHNSAKICRTWIISPHALLDLWYNICTKFHSNPCKDVGGVEKTNFDATEWRNDERTEWRTKQTLTAPLLWRGHKKLNLRSGSQRHRHFVGFFNVPAKHQNRTILFIRWFQHTAPFSRLLRHAGDMEEVFLT